MKNPESLGHETPPFLQRLEPQRSHCRTQPPARRHEKPRARARDGPPCRERWREARLLVQRELGGRQPQLQHELGFQGEVPLEDLWAGAVDAELKAEGRGGVGKIGLLTIPRVDS